MKNKILFVAPAFYDYHKVISSKLEELVGEVCFYPERKLGWTYSIINTISKKLTVLYHKIHFFFIWQKIKKQNGFTHFFVIRGDKMPISFVNQVKKNNPKIKTIMYQWDSIRNNPYTYLIPHFEKSFTFDYQDYKERKDLEFLQLFYTEDIKKISNEKQKIEYDFFCFNSFTLERYEATLKFLTYCKENNFSIKQFCYIPYSTYLKFKYLKRISLNKEIVSFQPMSRAEYLSYLAKSNCVVDINHSTQTGLSMRLVEAYGAGKKVITTNHSIKDNPIYNENWVHIFDIDNIKTAPFEGDKKDILANDLYIDNWLKTIFNI